MSGLMVVAAGGVDTRVGLLPALVGDITCPASVLGMHTGTRNVISGFVPAIGRLISGGMCHRVALVVTGAATDAPRSSDAT